jgi:starch synthase
VATSVGGIPEVVEDRVTGLLVSLAPASIAAALVTMFRDDVLRRRLGAAAADRAKRFSWSRVVEATEAVYDDALSRRAVRSAHPRGARERTSVA